MAEKTKKLTNTVSITGYLKENSLQKITNAKGMNIIKGNLIIATDKISSHKVQFYVSEQITSTGETSAEYEKLEQLLPANTISVASYLMDNKNADFDTAANAATKIWAVGRFDEYYTTTGEKENSYITIKGFRAGFATIDAEHPFRPHASFKVDGKIGKIDPEVVDNVETGRLLVELYVPKYNGIMDIMDFVGDDEYTQQYKVVDYIKKHYAVGDTICIDGDIVNLQESLVQEVSTNDDYFGKPREPQYQTKFIRERRITGGNSRFSPIKEGKPGGITKKEVEEGLIKRHEKGVENGNKSSRAQQRMDQNNSSANSDVSTFDEGFGF
jgi:hypothetical protein